MPGKLVKADDVGRALKRLLVADLADVGEALADPARSRAEGIHTARRKLKHARSVLRILRPRLGEDYERRRRALRDAAAALSETRDLDVMTATAAGLAGHAPDRLVPVIAGIADRLGHEAEAAHASETSVETVIAHLRQARSEAEALAEPHDGAGLFKAEFVRAYNAARTAMEEARDGRDEHRFHAWRKRVKHQFHLSRMAKGAGAAATKKTVADLDALGEILGLENDHAVLAARLLDDPLLAGDGRTADHIHEVIDARRARLQKKAFKLGKRLYADRPKTLRSGIALG